MKYEKPIADKNALTKSFIASARPTLTIDIGRYQTFLDQSGYSDEQKEEFLQALWAIIVAFVDLGFGVHPLQEVCGKDAESVAPSPKEDFDQVESGVLGTKSSTDKKSGP
jgi:hypothetical protein